MSLTLLELESDCLIHVLLFLPSVCSVQLSMSSKEAISTINGLAPLWRAFNWIDWRVESNLHEARGQWASFQRRYFPFGPLKSVIRFHRAFFSIESWIATHVPHIKDSMQPGIETVDEIDRLFIEDFMDDRTDVTIHPLVKLLYHLCNGQSIQGLSVNELKQITSPDMYFRSWTFRVTPSFIYQGMFGGFSAYNNKLSMRLLPLQQSLVYYKYVLGKHRHDPYLKEDSRDSVCQTLSLLSPSSQVPLFAL
jgi:hypothetical protein